MRRAVALGAILIAGGLSIAVSAFQQAAAPAPQTIEVQKLKDNLFLLKGGGGNTAVFVTDAGVAVVDAKNPGWGQPVLDKIKELTPKPVTTLINTHTHGDHVSGNVEFQGTVEVIAQENTSAHMQAMDIFKQNAGRGLPKRTFKDKMTIGSGADRIDLYYFGPGHTDGDAWVVFPALRVAHAGDLFPSRSLPLVDAANGGSVLHFAETLTKGFNGIHNVDTVIGGHADGPMPWADLKTFIEFNQDFLAWGKAQLAAGKTPEQAAPEWNVPAKYQGYAAGGGTLFGGVAGRLQRLSDEMKKP
jgi:glyoxylase-like metal-dependent hydrolase (beta-lactamase superfamily II)